MKRILAACMLLLLLLPACAPAQTEEDTPGYRQVTAQEAMELMERAERPSDYRIVDVRTAAEYGEKHIPGAVNIPNESIGQGEIPELPDKQQLLLIYCRSGNRSKQAAEKLVALGYTNVVEFGGINSWPGETVSAAEQEPAGEEPRSQNAGDSAGFVSVGEAVPDAILEIRYYSSYNFVGQRITGYEEPVALLSREAAAALKAVSDELMQQGYRLKIFDAYRPQQAVDHFKAWAADASDTKMQAYFYPQEDKSKLFYKGYIASRSGHSRGSTVDLTLFDMATGKEVDMGGPFDFFGELSHIDYAGLSDAQRENRQILRRAMTAHGFQGIRTEWWHFTLTEEPYPETYFTFPVKSLA